MCASRSRYFIAVVLGSFGFGDGGVGRSRTWSVGAFLFQVILSLLAFVVMPRFVHDCFHSLLFCAKRTSSSKDVACGASASIFDVSPLRYCIFTACLTRRSSSIRSMCPSHSCLRFLIASKMLNVLVRGLASSCADLPVMRDMHRALAPLIAALAVGVSLHASQPYVIKEAIAAL